MLLAILPVLTAFGYGILFTRMLQTRSFYLCPFFTLYCLTLTLYYPIWDARSEWQIAIQLTILSLRLCAGFEALGLAAETIGARERILLAAFIATMMAVGALITVQQGYGPGPLNIYRQIHQTANASMALGCLAGVGYFWIDPPRTKTRIRIHGSIFAMLAMSHAVTGFLKPWHYASVLFFLVSLLCIALWLWRGMLAQGGSKHRFQISNPIV
jgi:hypothetical protein